MTARSLVKKIDTYSKGISFRGILNYKHLAVEVYKQTGMPTIKKTQFIISNSH